MSFLKVYALPASIPSLMAAGHQAAATHIKNPEDPQELLRLFKRYRHVFMMALRNKIHNLTKEDDRRDLLQLAITTGASICYVVYTLQQLLNNDTTITLTKKEKMLVAAVNAKWVHPHIPRLLKAAITQSDIDAMKATETVGSNAAAIEHIYNASLALLPGMFIENKNARASLSSVATELTQSSSEAFYTKAAGALQRTDPRHPGGGGMHMAAE